MFSFNLRLNGAKETHNARWSWQQRWQRPEPRPMLESIVWSSYWSLLPSSQPAPSPSHHHLPLSIFATSNSLVVDTWVQDKTKEATGQKPASNWFAGCCWRPLRPPPIVHRFGLSSSSSFSPSSCSSCNYYQLMYATMRGTVLCIGSKRQLCWTAEL